MNRTKANTEAEDIWVMESQARQVWDIVSAAITSETNLNHEAKKLEKRSFAQSQTG